MGRGQCDSLGEYCGLNTASSVFFILVHFNLFRRRSPVVIKYSDDSPYHRSNVMFFSMASSCQQPFIAVLAMLSKLFS